jgi:hypothetical protein
MTGRSILQVLRFYKKKLMALTERLHDEQVGHSQVQIADDSLDEKLQALSNLAGECHDHVLCLAAPPSLCLHLSTPLQVGFKVAGPALDISPQDLSQGPMLAYSHP